MVYVKYDVQGNEWGVTCYELVIPEDRIEGMTAREIGEHVISLMAKIKEVREEEEREYFEHCRPRRSGPPSLNRPKVYEALVNRDGHVCQVPTCLAEGPYQIDHVVPKSKGGTDDLSNLQLLCQRHNAQKRDKSWEAFKNEPRR